MAISKATQNYTIKIRCLFEVSKTTHRYKLKNKNKQNILLSQYNFVIKTTLQKFYYKTIIHHSNTNIKFDVNYNIVSILQ